MQFRNLVENQHKKPAKNQHGFNLETGIIKHEHPAEKGIENLLHFEYIFQEEKHENVY